MFGSSKCGMAVLLFLHHSPLNQLCAGSRLGHPSPAISAGALSTFAGSVKKSALQNARSPNGINSTRGAFMGEHCQLSNHSF